MFHNNRNNYDYKLAKIPGQGVRLTAQSIYIIKTICEFFEEEKRMKKSGLRYRVVEWTAKATRVSKRIVTNIHASMTQDKTFLTPKLIHSINSMHTE